MEEGRISGRDRAIEKSEASEFKLSPANVCFGSKADIRRYPVERPLLGVKRTSKGG